jgi:intracellular sulfur oxidation DsrE/DsrF family protein
VNLQISIYRLSQENNMKDKNQPGVGRRELLSSIGVAAVAGLAVSASQVSAQPAAQPAGFQPARHNQDNWLDEMPGSHRVIVDSSTPVGGASALWYANNIISAHEESYEGSAADYAMVVCFRHLSTPYGFDDGIWAKYGSFFNRAADPAPTANPMNTAGPSSGGNSIDSSVARGVQFAICGRATRRLAMAIASSTGVTADEAFAELAAGLIPNARMVPAGVVTVTRAQERGYSLLYAE